METMTSVFLSMGPVFAGLLLAVSDPATSQTSMGGARLEMPVSASSD